MVLLPGQNAEQVPPPRLLEACIARKVLPLRLRMDQSLHVRVVRKAVLHPKLTVHQLRFHLMILTIHLLPILTGTKLVFLIVPKVQFLLHHLTHVDLLPPPILIVHSQQLLKKIHTVHNIHRRRQLAWYHFLLRLIRL